MRLRRKRWSKMAVEHVGGGYHPPPLPTPAAFCGHTMCAPTALREMSAGTGLFIQLWGPIPRTMGRRKTLSS